MCCTCNEDPYMLLGFEGCTTKMVQVAGVMKADLDRQWALFEPINHAVPPCTSARLDVSPCLWTGQLPRYEETHPDFFAS